MALTASEFFSFDHFHHPALFEEGKPVWSAIGLLDSYFKKLGKATIEITIPSGVFIQRPELVWIGKETIIEPGVFIQGPCWIGNHCIIRHGAYLRGGVICSDRCVVGHGTEVKNSIFFHAASAAHFSYIGDSILGNGVNLGAAVKCANLRLDRKEISLFLENEKIKTGFKKLGSIIGDFAQIGCNAVLNPGTIIGKKSLIHPLVNVKGIIPPFSQVVHQNSYRIEPLEQRILP